MIKFNLKQQVGMWCIILWINMLHIVVGNIIQVDTLLVGGLFVILPFSFFCVLSYTSKEPSPYSCNIWVYGFFILASIPYLFINELYSPLTYISNAIRCFSILFVFYIVRFYQKDEFVFLAYKVGIVSLFLQLIALLIFFYDPSLSQLLFYIPRKAIVENYDFLTRFSGTVAEVNVLPYFILLNAYVVFSTAKFKFNIIHYHKWSKPFFVFFTFVCVILSGSRGGGIALCMVIIIMFPRTLIFSSVLLFVISWGLWENFATEIINCSVVLFGDNSLLTRIAGDTEMQYYAEASSYLRKQLIFEALEIFSQKPFAIRGFLFSNFLMQVLPHSGVIYLLMSYGIFAFYPIYIFCLKNCLVAIKQQQLAIYAISMLFFFLSVDAMYYFLFPWMSILLEHKLTAIEGKSLSSIVAKIEPIF